MQESLWHTAWYSVVSACVYIWQTNMPAIAEQTHEQLRVTTLISGEAFSTLFTYCVHVCAGYVWKTRQGDG